MYILIFQLLEEGDRFSSLLREMAIQVKLASNKALPDNSTRNLVNFFS